MTAYHESGHALLAWLVPGADRLHKVTIIPRGRSLGVTQLLPEEDRVNIGESELHARLCSCWAAARPRTRLRRVQRGGGKRSEAGHAAGPPNGHPLGHERAARAGRLPHSEEHPFLGKEMAEQRRFSEHTAQVIDEEVSRLCAAADKATAIIMQNRDKLDTLAKNLEETETLGEEDIEKLIGPPFYKKEADGPSGRRHRKFRYRPRLRPYPRGAHDPPMIAHNVFFTLNDNQPAMVQAMIDDCHKYLAHLPGVIFYAAGTCSDVDRAVSDRDYDVGAARGVSGPCGALDEYMNAPKHVEFMDKHLGNWKEVRVFDWCVSGA